MNETPTSSPRLPALLIVDDSLSVCLALEFALTRAGYRVLLAESGTAALAQMATHVIEGVLIDVHMPGLNGFDTCVRLRERTGEREQPLRVWFMTGGAARDHEAKAAELGTLGVLRKPFDFPTLLAALETGLSPSLPQRHPAAVSCASNP